MNFKSTSTVESNLTLSDKLAKINYPQPAPLESGYASTIKEFYDTFILQHMFNKDSVLKIHRALLEYIRVKLHQIYGKEYEEFLKLIMAPNAPIEADGDKVINLHYGLNISKNNQSKTSKIVSPAKKTTKSKTSSSPRDLQTMGVSWFVSYEYCRRIDSTHNNWKLATKQSSRLSAYRNSEGDNKTRYNYLEQICLKSAKRLSLNEMELDGAQVLNMAIELVKYYEKYKLI